MYKLCNRLQENTVNLRNHPWYCNSFYAKNIMRYNQIRIANAQRDSEKYRILKEEILDK